MAKNGFYTAPRQLYFEYVTQNTILSTFTYGVAVLTPSGISVSSGELSADFDYVQVDVPVLMSGPASSTPVEVRVKPGEPIDYSRTLSEDERPQVAVSGVDFDPLAESYTIPAGAFRTTIPVRFKRSSIVQADEAGKELILDLQPSSGVALSFTDRVRYRIRINDVLQEPEWWIGFTDQGMNILGDYSRVKHQYLLEKLPYLTEIKGRRAGEAYTSLNIGRIAYAALAIHQEHPELGLNETQIRNFIP